MSAEILLFFSELIKSVVIVLFVLFLFWIKKRIFEMVRKS